MSPITRSQARQLQGRGVTRTVNDDGVHIITRPSATGQGTHTAWVYPKEAAPGVSAGPTLSSLTSLSESMSSIESNRPQTPPPRASWTAGSATRTPKKLQRSPNRIGGHGIDIWNDGSGVVVQGIVDGDGRPREDIDLNVGGREPRTSGGPEDTCMDGDRMETKLKIEMRERELVRLMQDLQTRNEPVRQQPMIDEDVFEGHARPAGDRRLGPEGTHLFSDSDSTDSDDSDTDMEKDLDELQESRNRRAQTLGVEPTIIIRPNNNARVNGNAGRAPRPLRYQSTEIIF